MTAPTAAYADRLSRVRTGDGRARRRRAAAVGRRRPAVPHRLRGDAARAAHDARRAPRRRGHVGRSHGSRPRGWSSSRECSRSGRGTRPTIRWRSSPISREKRRPPRSATRRGRGSCLPFSARCRRRRFPRAVEVTGALRAQKDDAEIDALRDAPAPRPTEWPRLCSQARSRSSGAPRRRSRPRSRRGCSRRATIRSTSPSSRRARTPRVRTTTRVTASSAMARSCSATSAARSTATAATSPVACHLERRRPRSATRTTCSSRRRLLR